METCTNPTLLMERNREGVIARMTEPRGLYACPLFHPTLSLIRASPPDRTKWAKYLHCTKGMVPYLDQAPRLIIPLISRSSG